MRILRWLPLQSLEMPHQWMASRTVARTQGHNLNIPHAHETPQTGHPNRAGNLAFAQGIATWLDSTTAAK